jgi:hypothetical protein
LKELTELSLSAGVLTIAGSVGVANGSELNMTIADFAEKYPGAWRKVSRAGCRFIPRHIPKGDYELSPDDADLTEYKDDAATLARKLDFAARAISRAKHLVVYTGAGISTAAKIADFRGPNGAWTRRDRGQAPPESISMEAAQPTMAHRALVKLLDSGVLKYVTSQNVDGLHRRSGIKAEQISELHGTHHPPVRCPLSLCCCRCSLCADWCSIPLSIFARCVDAQAIAI